MMMVMMMMMMMVMMMMMMMMMNDFCELHRTKIVGVAKVFLASTSGKAT